MIQLKSRRIGKYLHFVAVNTKNRYQIGILSSYGAALNQFVVYGKNGFQNVVFGYNREEDFVKLYRSVVLSPFPNRIEDGKFTFNNKEYNLPINRPQENNALHGFLYNKAFKITESKIVGDSIELELQHQAVATEYFPFSYTQTVEYQWNGAELLQVTCKIKNTSETAMPYGLGWHPYFTLGENVNDWQLQFPAKNIFEVDERNIPKGTKTDYKKFDSLSTIASEQFDDCFEIENSKPTILKNSAKEIELKITFPESDLAYDYLQIYTPKERNSIAIEPMTCAPNAFNNKEGICVLQAGEEKVSKYNLEVLVF